MRRILFCILILALCPLLFGALQVLPAPVIFPWKLVQGFALTGSTLTINGTDELDEVAALISIPATGTLTDIAIATGTVTTGETAVPFRVETVGTDGNPSGTLYDAAGTGTVDIAITDDDVIKDVPINGGTGITVTLSDQVFVRWKRKTITPTLVAQFRYAALNSIITHPGMRDYNITAGAAWTKLVGMPQIALKIGGAWISPHFCLGGLQGTLTNEAFQTAAERAILINLPISCRVVGAVANIFSASNTFKYTMYSDPTGTPASVAVTPTIDADTATSTVSGRYTVGMFTVPYTPAASTSYAVAVTPLEAINVNLSYWLGDATYGAAFPGGATNVGYTRASGGATSFTIASPLRVPFIGVIIDAIDTGSSGGKWISDLREFRGLDSFIAYWSGPKYTRRVVWAGQ